MKKTEVQITKFWSTLKRQISVEGGVSYTELGALDVYKFFVLLVSYEEEVKAKVAANKKATEKQKRKK